MVAKDKKGLLQIFTDIVIIIILQFQLCIYTYISLLVLFYFVFIIIIPCYYYEFYIFYLRKLWKITFTTKKVAMLTNAEIIFVLNDAATFIWCNNGTCYSIKVRNIGTIALYWSRIENEMLWMQTRQVKISLVCTSHTEDRSKMDCNNKGIHFMSSVCVLCTGDNVTDNPF